MRTVRSAPDKSQICRSYSLISTAARTHGTEEVPGGDVTHETTFSVIYIVAYVEKCKGR